MPVSVREAHSLIRKAKMLGPVLLLMAVGAAGAETVGGLDLPDGYSATTVPAAVPGSPLEVSCTFHLFNIQEINDLHQYIEVEVFTAFVWTDPRLATPGLNSTVEFSHLSPKVLEAIWRPDLFLYWSKETSVVSTYDQALSLNIHQGTGRVFWSTIFRLKVNCIMDFKSFPLDSHECSVMIGSFTQNKLHLIFTTQEFLAFDSYDKKLPHFKISVDEIPPAKREFPSRVEAAGTFSRAGFDITVERKVLPFILNTYFPTGTLVLVSWISFFIPVDMVPGRMALLVTLFLMLINTANSSDKSNPPASTPTALDVWLRCCMFFVAGAIFEYAGLLYVCFGLGVRRKISLCDVQAKELSINQSGKIDKVAVFVFMLLFTLFNFVYWLLYLA